MTKKIILMLVLFLVEHIKTTRKRPFYRKHFKLIGVKTDIIQFYDTGVCELLYQTKLKKKSVAFDDKMTDDNSLPTENLNYEEFITKFEKYLDKKKLTKSLKRIKTHVETFKMNPRDSIHQYLLQKNLFFDFLNNQLKIKFKKIFDIHFLKSRKTYFFTPFLLILRIKPDVFDLTKHYNNKTINENEIGIFSKVILNYLYLNNLLSVYHSNDIINDPEEIEPDNFDISITPFYEAFDKNFFVESFFKSLNDPFEEFKKLLSQSKNRTYLHVKSFYTEKIINKTIENHIGYCEFVCCSLICFYTTDDDLKNFLNQNTISEIDNLNQKAKILRFKPMDLYEDLSIKKIYISETIPDLIYFLISYANNSQKLLYIKLLLYIIAKFSDFKHEKIFETELEKRISELKTKESEFYKKELPEILQIYKDMKIEISDFNYLLIYAMHYILLA